MKRTLRCVAIATMVSTGLIATAQTDMTGDLTTFSEADSTGKLWNKGGVFLINMNQVGLTNWAAGGFSSIAGAAQINAFANRKKGRKAWDNSLVLAIGGLKIDEADWVKSDDRIELNSKYGYQLKEEGKLFLAGLFQFKTQFTEGFDTGADSLGNFQRISNFMAPGFFTAGIGLDYKPNDNFSLFFSPATARYIVVSDQNLADAGQFGVEGAFVNDQGNLVSGENSVFQFGGYLKAQYQKENLLKNVNFLTRFDLFSNYLDNPGNIDVTWETLWTLKVNTWLGATITTLLIYDDDTDIARDLELEADGVTPKPDQILSGPATQFKETIGVGLTFTF